MHPADGLFQNDAIRRGRKAGAEDMTIDVELVVLDPARIVDIEGRFLQTGLKDRRDMNPVRDHLLEVFEEVALVTLGQLEDRHASDMHRHLGRF